MPLLSFHFGCNHLARNSTGPNPWIIRTENKKDTSQLDNIAKHNPKLVTSSYSLKLLLLAGGYNMNQINLTVYSQDPHHEQFCPAPSARTLSSKDLSDTYRRSPTLLFRCLLACLLRTHP